MKNKIALLLTLILISFSCFAQHSEKDYVENPEYARLDAEWNESNGNIEKAIKLYKIYSILSGEETSDIVSRLNKQLFPEWFNPSVMEAITLDDETVLFIYKKLMYLSVWDSKIDEVITIPGISGDWRININEKYYKALKSKGVYVPSEGLYVGIDTSMSAEVSPYTGKGDLWYYRKVKLMTDSGIKQIDCGSYSEKYNFLSNVRLGIGENKRIYKRVAYYPYRVMRNENGCWTDAWIIVKIPMK